MIDHEIQIVMGWFVFFSSVASVIKILKVFGRHEWRCRKKLNNQQEDTRQRTYSSDSSSIHLDQSNNKTEEANERLLSSNPEISCVCGKACKGNRGLKSHEHAC